jgi:hypothetical protein
MTTTIYLDADGVCLDWSGKVQQIFEGRNVADIPKKELWIGITQYDKHIEKFFLNLELLDDAVELIRYCQEHFDNVEILTASGYTPADAGEQKRQWFANNFPEIKVNVVRKSEDKAAYANTCAILIDDREKCTLPFIAAGGFAILHKNTKDTIRQLQAYIT